MNSPFQPERGTFCLQQNTGPSSGIWLSQIGGFPLLKAQVPGNSTNISTRESPMNFWFYGKVPLSQKKRSTYHGQGMSAEQFKAQFEASKGDT